MTDLQTTTEQTDTTVDVSESQEVEQVTNVEQADQTVNETTNDQPVGQEVKADAENDSPDGSDNATTEQPEKYEFVAPEGSELSDVVNEAYSEVARELNLSQEDAQKVIDAVSPKLAESQRSAIEAMQNKWADESRNHPEFGGDKFDQSLGQAKKVIGQFSPEGFGEFLTETGLGNHPMMIEYALNVSKAMSEDSYVGQGGSKVNRGPMTSQSAASLLYTKSLEEN